MDANFIFFFFLILERRIEGQGERTTNISLLFHLLMYLLVDLFFFFKILFIFREMGSEGERKGEKHQCEKHQSVASHMHPKPVTFRFAG